MFVRSGSLYVPAPLGRLAIPSSGSAPVPLPTYVPTSEGELESWAAQQADVWNRPAVKQMVSDTRAGISAAVQHEFPETAPLTESATYQWSIDYVEAKGFPTNEDEALDMTMAFLEQQGQSIGFHPAFLNAAELYEDWPDTPEEGVEWMARTASNIGAQYGLPIPQDLNAKSLVTAGASAAMQTAGVPGVAVATVTIDAFWDGKVTAEEVRSMVVAVGAAVGAAVGQMFGIPAPIGGFVGGLVTDVLVGGLYDALGLTDSAADKRGKAWNAMLKARNAMMQQCLSVATEAWDKYNAFWNELITKLQTALNEQTPGLGEGLRYFGTFFVSRVEDSHGVMHQLPQPFGRNCERTSGCLYYESYNERRGTYIREPASKPSLRHMMPQVRYSGNAVPGAVQQSSGGNYISAYLALAYWGAERFVTPYHALREYAQLDGGWLGTGTRQCWEGGRMSGSPVACWDRVPHTDQEYLEHLSFVQRATRPEDLKTCIVPKWADYMFESLAQVGPALSLVNANIGQTVAAVTSERRIAAEMELLRQQQQQAAAARMMAVRAAQARRELLRQRRARASLEATFNAGLFASGVGALAGWAASEILSRR